MSFLNILLHLNGYEDLNPTNNPSQNNFKWNVNYQGINIGEPESKVAILSQGQSIILNAGTTNLNDDNTTTYDISQITNTANSYRIKHNGGTAPTFRTLRSIGTNSSTQLTLTKNGPLLILTDLSSVNFNTSNILIGDEVRLGSVFSPLNQGKYKILSKTSNSITVEHSSSIEETVSLSIDFNAVFFVNSFNGVQIEDKVTISSGFSSVVFGTYEIIDVAYNYLDIYSIKVLPEETAIQTNLDIYDSSKKFLYIESNQKLLVEINGEQSSIVEPIAFGTVLKPGMFLNTGTMYDIVITNLSESTNKVFYITAE